MRLIGAMRSGVIVVECIATSVILDNVSNVRRVGVDIISAEYADVIDCVLYRFANEFGVAICELKFFGRCSGLFDAPRHKNCRPWNSNAGKRKT